MIPGDRALKVRWKNIRGFGQLERSVPHCPGGLLLIVFGNDMPLRAPRIDRRRHRDRLRRFPEHLHHRQVRVNKNFQDNLLRARARGDLAKAVAQFQFLPKRRARRKRIRRQRNAHFSDFVQPRNFAVGIAAADVESQVSALLHPEIDADLAVPQGHRPGGVSAWSRPNHVCTAPSNAPRARRLRRGIEAKRSELSSFYGLSRSIAKATLSFTAAEVTF